MAKNKIIMLGLQDRVEELIASGICSGTKISEALKAAGHDVSQSTVSRYLSSIEKDRHEETKQIVSDHVRAKVPADLDALEAMEEQCLSWAKEDNDAFAHRLARKHIQEAAQSWLDKITALTCADPKERKCALEAIIDQCLLWIADDFKLQNARLAAMKQATAIIGMKLNYALGDNQDGKIVFLDEARGDRVERDAETGSVLVFRGGSD